jgi:hypothetical protein
MNLLISNSKWSGGNKGAEGDVDYEEYDFDDLPKDVRTAAKFLGFTRAIWDEDGKIPVESKEWNDLTAKQQKAATTLGYTQAKWDDSDSDSSSSSESVKKEDVSYEEYDFDDLPKDAKKAAEFLGFTKFIWDEDGKIPVESKEWVDLTAKQQKAATTLGYTQAKWDDSDSSSSSSSENTEKQGADAMPTVAVPAVVEEKEVTTSAIRQEKDINYDDLDFDELPTKALKAAKLLGYTSSTWDNDKKIPIESKDWVDLTAAEQNAASIIGYTREKWDDSDSDSSSSSSSSVHSPRRQPDTAVVNVEKDEWVTFSREEIDLANFGIIENCGSLVSPAEPWDEPPSSVINESDLASIATSRSLMQHGSTYSLTNYGVYRFEHLPSHIQQAAMVLGFTQTTWDRNLFIPRKSKTWDTFTPAELEAAKILGCTEEKWEKLLDSW